MQGQVAPWGESVCDGVADAGREADDDEMTLAQGLAMNDDEGGVTQVDYEGSLGQGMVGEVFHVLLGLVVVYVLLGLVVVYAQLGLVVVYAQLLAGDCQDSGAHGSPPTSGGPATAADGLRGPKQV